MASFLDSKANLPTAVLTHRRMLSCSVLSARGFSSTPSLPWHTSSAPFSTSTRLPSLMVECSWTLTLPMPYSLDRRPLASCTTAARLTRQRMCFLGRRRKRHRRSVPGRGSFNQHYLALWSSPHGRGARRPNIRDASTDCTHFLYMFLRTKASTGGGVYHEKCKCCYLGNVGK